MGYTGAHKEKGLSTKEFLKQELDWERKRILECVFVNPGEAYMACMDETTGKIYGEVVLISYNHNDYFNVTYKTIPENMGPFYCNCPEKILKQLNEPENDCAREWRKKCRVKIKKAQAQKVKDGDIIKFEKPIEFTNGDKLDTFQVIKTGKTGRKVRFKAVYEQNGEHIIFNNLYRITNLKEREYQIL